MLAATTSAYSIVMRGGKRIEIPDAVYCHQRHTDLRDSSGFLDYLADGGH